MRSSHASTLRASGPFASPKRNSSFWTARPAGAIVVVNYERLPRLHVGDLNDRPLLLPHNSQLADGGVRLPMRFTGRVAGFKCLPMASERKREREAAGSRQAEEVSGYLFLSCFFRSLSASNCLAIRQDGVLEPQLFLARAP